MWGTWGFREGNHVRVTTVFRSLYNVYDAYKVMRSVLECRRLFQSLPSILGVSSASTGVS